MEHLIIPENYSSALNLHDTQIGIKTVKDFFQSLLVRHLNLLRVSAPLFVDPASGMNVCALHSGVKWHNDIVERNGGAR